MLLTQSDEQLDHGIDLLMTSGSMWFACYGTGRYGVLVQIRDVPEPVHSVPKARAAAAGMSFSEHLRTVLARTAERPTPEELAARITARGVVARDESSVRSVRRLRDRGE
ncbi:MAG: hypothetical protein WKF94_18600 [Solirubrobacteraceae bacterium]